MSNFPNGLLREAAQSSGVALVTNQVEYHPFLRQDAVLAEHGVSV